MSLIKPLNLLKLDPIVVVYVFYFYFIFYCFNLNFNLISLMLSCFWDFPTRIRFSSRIKSLTYLKVL